MKGKQLQRRLRQAGVEISRRKGGGGHYLLRYQGKKATLPFHGDADISPEFIKKLCGQLGLDPQEVL